jgi:toxin ParE1/3/4
VSYRIVWSESALDRVTEFLDFIAEDNPAAARRVVQNLFDRVQVLADHPHLGRRLLEGIDPSLRRIVIGSYIVVYEVVEARQMIAIIAVRHHRQKLLPQEES